MISVRLLRTGLTLALLALLAWAPAAWAQSVTTGTLTGSVSGTADAGGGVLPGATVSAVHVPTGTKYTAITGSDGRFVIPNVKPGGPYTVSATVQGYKTTDVSGVQVQVGAGREVALQLPLAAVEETIEVVATADQLINPNRTGATSAVSTKQLETLPTLHRSLQDFARTNPYFSVDQADASQTTMSVGGRNNRYNTVQIDGAVNNDLFGLASTGTPGGQTDTQPISLDAISQLQMVVSPYDVRQGGFTGGGINAVTRSGSNQFTGSAYGSRRDENWVGNGPTDTKIASFKETQYGFRLGGPVIHDNLFFFVNGEINRRDAPTGTSADGSAANNYHGTTNAAAVRQTLITKYGYDPGALGDISGATDSDLAFARLDWNIATGETATLRHNYVKGAKDIIADRTSTRFRFPNSTYTQADKTNSTVFQLNSIFGEVFNEGRLGYQTIRDIRDVPSRFPTLEVGGVPRSADVIAGTEQFSTANSLDQDIFELTDDVTFVKGAHDFTVGTHNEFFKFSNLFISSAFGYYFFPNQAALDAGQATEYDIVYANGSDPRAPTEFHVRQYSLYGSDQWRANDRLTFTFGLRADKPSYQDTPPFNPLVMNELGRSTASTPSESVVWSPRIGFNWDPSGKGKDQVRGGVGIFAGRPPYVWVSNAYGGTGITSTSLQCQASRGCVVPLFNPDPDNQPHAGVAGSSVSVDMVDPGFKFPRILRTTLGYDRELPWGMHGSIEGVFSQTQEDVFYESVNNVQTGNSVLDGRPTYSPISPKIGNATWLTNTSKGSEELASLQLTKALSHGWSAYASYTYMDAKSAFDATSSIAFSNFRFFPTQGDIFKQHEDTSVFEVKHHFIVAPSYTFQTGSVSHDIGILYNVQSGRPYSLLINSDINKDGSSNNDLLFVPGEGNAIIEDSAGHVIPYATFATFLSNAGIDPSTHGILKRNQSWEPWVHELDFHYGIGLPISVVHTQLAFDVLNFLNIFNKDWGTVRFVNNQTFAPVKYVGQDAATGKPIYQATSPVSLNPGAQFSQADLRSRWQGKLSLRISF
jgi:outer membrane receptor protein involved in Fe transport